jgi:hypothetical protein
VCACRSCVDLIGLILGRPGGGGGGGGTERSAVAENATRVGIV